MPNFGLNILSHVSIPFGLLLTSPLGFKARVGSALFALGRGRMSNITCSLKFTSGATPADLFAASMAVKRETSRSMSECSPTELCQLGLWYLTFLWDTMCHSCCVGDPSPLAGSRQRSDGDLLEVMDLGQLMVV